MTRAEKNSASEWRSLGLAHAEAGRWDEAAHALERALALEPGCADSWYQLGNVHQEQKLDGEAAECFERATALDPSRAQAWNNLAVSRECLGELAQAAAAYRRALQEDPSLLPALLNLAYNYLRTGAHAQAVPLLERATSLNRLNPNAWENLGFALAQVGNRAAADAALRTAADTRNELARPLLAQAEAAMVRGDRGETEKNLAAALEVLPGNPTLMHMLAAQRGATSTNPPQGYVAALFDGFAQKYDRKMIDLLEYRVPDLLAEIVMADLQRVQPARVVDLGCGTGLLGVALAGARPEIVGIDLSAQMLHRAEQLGIYARLVQGDVVEELRGLPQASAEAVLAADVFVYMGDLQPVFSATARVLAPRGLFAFSVEDSDEDDYRVNISGRYAHSRDYLRRLAASNGLVERSMQRIHPRREGDRYIEGWLACFVAAAGAAD